ncbi:MAG: DMT family transporter [Actinomycetota bacterium]|nr:DMT family transporter [Actinomycetota bacterium]
MAAVGLAALGYGSTFLAMRVALAHVGPFPLLVIRFVVAAAVLWPFARRRTSRPGVWRAAIAPGAALGAGYLMQTYGLRSVTGPVSAFLTYLLVIFVPILSAAWLRRIPSRATLAGAAVGLAGIWLLSGGVGALTSGELLTVGCALAFALNIVLVTRLRPGYDALRLATAEMVVTAAMCAGPALVYGRWSASPSALAWILFTAVVASSAGFTLQTWGQQRLSAARVSVLLMLEPFVAAVIGAAVGVRIGPEGWAGAALILTGVMLSELDLPRLMLAVRRGRQVHSR